MGRFINADEVNTSIIPNTILQHNLFAYCMNDPINETDAAGNLAAQLIARIILGIMIGIFSQLLIDLINYWFYKISNNLKNFSLSVGDYVSSAISWALTCVTFSRKTVEICAALIPILIKHVYRAFNKNFDWIDLCIDCGYVLISFFINKQLGKAQKNKIRKIKKEIGTGNKAWNKIRISTKRINKQFKVYGLKANLYLNISSSFTSLIYGYIMSKKV